MIDAFAQWDAAIRSQENQVPEKYSGLIRSIETVFDIARAGNDKYLAVFLNTLNGTTEFLTTPKSRWLWSLIDNKIVSSHDPLHLMLGFDLDLEFDQQFPEHLAQATVWDYFTMQPLIWFPDRAGKIPALEQQRAVKKMLEPPKPKLGVIRPS